MRSAIRKEEVSKLVGKDIVALKKDGTTVAGKLVEIKGNKLVVAPEGQKAHTKAIVPLVLFDLLAIGTAPYAFGGYGYPGYGAGYGGFGFGPGPGFFL